MADHPKSGSDNDDDGVVRSTGATQQEGYSPLLARLLDETMRDAEREKQNLDETIREKEAEARRKREEEAIARRTEIQRRVEEEQARRQALIAAAQGKPEEGEATAERVEAHTSTAVTVEPAKSSGGMLPWVLVVLLAGGCGALYMKFSGDVEVLQGDRAEVVQQLTALNGKLEKALSSQEKNSLDGKASPAIIGIIDVGLDALIEEEKSQREAATSADSSKASAEKRLADAEEKLKKQEVELKRLVEENTQLTADLEAIAASKPSRKAKRSKKKAPAAPKSKKVNVNTDIFNPNAR